MSFLQGMFGPPNIKSLVEKRHVTGLIKALNYKRDSEVRRAAAEALGQIGDVLAVEPLTLALRDSEGHVRQAAAVALGDLADARAVSALIPCLGDAIGVRQAASEALAKIGQPAAPRLAAVLDSGARASRSHNRPVPEIQAASQALVKMGEPAIEPLLDMLERTYHAEACAEATGALREIVAIHTVAPLLAVLKDRKTWDAKTANLLGQIGDVRAVEWLVAALSHSGYWVRKSAVVALGQIGDACVVEPLVGALKDTSEEVRRAAALALDQLGHADRVETMAMVHVMVGICVHDPDVFVEPPRSVRNIAQSALARSSLAASLSADAKTAFLIARGGLSLAESEAQARQDLPEQVEVFMARDGLSPRNYDIQYFSYAISPSTKVLWAAALDKNAAK